MFRDLLLIFIGLSSGFLIAAGVISFIVKIGVITRFMTRTKTVKHAMLYEDFIILGGTIGNLLYIYKWDIPGDNILLAIFGMSAGVFVGCLALSLAETLNVIPIFTKRVNLKKGLRYIILSMSLGKFAGAFIQLYTNWKS